MLNLSLLHLLTLGSRAHSEDWHIPAGYPVQGVINNFESILDSASSMNSGFIVLACANTQSCVQLHAAHISNFVLRHDLYVQTVEVAVGYVLPYVHPNAN